MSSPNESGKKPGESLFGFALLIFSLFVFYNAYKISGFSSLSSPGSFPLAASAVMCLSACFIIIKNVKTSLLPNMSFFKDVLPLSIVTVVALLLVFSLALEHTGFVLAAVVFEFVMLLSFYKRKVSSALLITVVSIVVIYVIFRLVFQVVLPEGILPEREIIAWFKTLLGGG